MQHDSIFSSPAERARRHKEKLYAIGDKVSEFFFENAPEKFGFEEREGQIDMAFEILDAIKERRHIVVEAGVGIGKSFAYLLPLLYYNRLTQKPVVIATSTIALQEQLYDDVQRLKDLLNLNPSVCLFKGQTHYVCKKRAYEHLRQTKHPIEDCLKEEISAGIFDRRQFSSEIPQELWSQINVLRFSRYSCYGCRYRDECGYYLMREHLRWDDGFILCNQDILTAHLKKISRGSEGLLPFEIDTIVVDEAHNLESKVRSSTTNYFSQKKLCSLVEASVKETRGIGRESVQLRMQDARKYMNVLYAELNRQVQIQVEKNTKEMQYAESFSFESTAETKLMLKNMTIGLQKLAEVVDLYASYDFKRSANNSVADELTETAQALRELMSDYDNQLVWIEKSGGKDISLVYCPKNTCAEIRRLFFNGTAKTVLTSATLTNQGSGPLNDQYGYFLQNTGFPTDKRGIISEPKPSPFPYDKHAMIYFCNDLPHPTHDHDAFIDQGVDRLISLLRISNGRALILFTAKADMDEVYDRLSQAELPFKVLKQQPGSSQEIVLNQFKENVNSVLLGSGAYWEGISIEGKSLSHLVVFRLPFPMPDPIMDYKASIAQNPLMDVQVPEMIIKLKQGIGRLIRNFTDKGIVSIIDSRLRDEHPTSYHDIAWDSLPIKNRTDDIQVIKAFYENLALED